MGFNGFNYFTPEKWHDWGNFFQNEIKTNSRRFWKRRKKIKKMVTDSDSWVSFDEYI